jgi:hypothetical protein
VLHAIDDGFVAEADLVGNDGAVAIALFLAVRHGLIAQ